VRASLLDEPREEMTGDCSITSSLSDGLQRLDECRSLPLVLRRPKRLVLRTEQAAHRGPGRASLTRCTMKHGEGFVDLPSMRHRISKVWKVLEGESRRWSAVSQRVPRDAHQRFVETDVLGRRHRILGEEMPCWPPGARISVGTRADTEKRPLRPEG
jgi:hypothetical protein